MFGDPNMAAAVIDRTVRHGRIIRFQGESYRSRNALMSKWTNQNKTQAAGEPQGCPSCGKPAAHPAENNMTILLAGT